MRVTSELWVAALMRKVQGEGAFATVVRRGTAEAGAIFLIVNDFSGAFSLYAPAPQTFYAIDEDGGRKFEQRLANAPEADVLSVVEREHSFDPDIWVVEIEDRQGRSFIDI